MRRLAAADQQGGRHAGSITKGGRGRYGRPRAVGRQARPMRRRKPARPPRTGVTCRPRQETGRPGCWPASTQ
ncbi:hypothetical protein WQQ_21770 [Hydrocarboniphaga effusa AP103]|uniref:Uncharacterized protein n=1 Tax=Hydrocarboniphaga effusa AP103 TaxID=1172194 RepID=I8TDJ9_9GAMM|nr:hypothetical protein WQQ_21770 [Hydrocarboniphaga effusa AP103]